MDHKACMFFKEPCYCKVLSDRFCIDNHCGFFKTRDQQALSLALVYERLRKRSPQEQQEIALKYYNGKMPWQNGGVRV